jgi:hypothetical protein
MLEQSVPSEDRLSEDGASTIIIPEGRPSEPSRDGVSTIMFLSIPSLAKDRIKPVPFLGKVGTTLSHPVISERLASKFADEMIDRNDRTVISAFPNSAVSRGKIRLSFGVMGNRSVWIADFYILPNAMVQHGQTYHDPDNTRTNYDAILNWSHADKMMKAAQTNFQSLPIEIGQTKSARQQSLLPGCCCAQ